MVVRAHSQLLPALVCSRTAMVSVYKLANAVEQRMKHVFKHQMGYSLIDGLELVAELGSLLK